MKLVAQVKLLANPEQIALLEQTLQQANAACNFLAALAWQEQVFRRYPLHRLAYARARAAFPTLAAQVIVRCIARVADAYRVHRQHPCHFARHGAIASCCRPCCSYTTARLKRACQLNGANWIARPKSRAARLSWPREMWAAPRWSYREAYAPFLRHLGRLDNSPLPG